MDNPFCYVACVRRKEVFPVADYWAGYGADMIVLAPMLHSLLPQLDRMVDGAITIPRSLTYRTTGVCENEHLRSCEPHDRHCVCVRTWC